MNTYAKPINTRAYCCSGSNNVTRLINFNSKKFSKRTNLKLVMNIIKAVLEYCLTIHIGAVIGCLLGFLMGKIYVTYFNPAHFPNLTEVTKWLGLPYSFAMYGVILGASLGAIVITILIAKERPCNLKSEKKGGEV